MLVVEVEALVFFLDLLGQGLAESLNFSVELQHSLSICLLSALSGFVLHVWALEWLGRLLEPR